MNYRIGLDLGISSVGWAVLEHDEHDKPRRIVDLGVRVFDPAEKPKDGSSLAVERRNARGLRRRLRRKANRVKKCKEYLSQALFDSKDIYNVTTPHDIYKIRYNALYEKISLEELYVTILYFVKHRGFKSNRKAELENKDAGDLLKAIKANNENAEQYQTIGEYIYCDSHFYEMKTKNGVEYKEYKVRNHDGQYDKCFARVDLEKELRIILDKQRVYYSDVITQDFIETVLTLFNIQRSFDDGPNDPSPYKSNFAVGMCTLEPGEYRAPKGSFTFEYFTALNKLNNLTILDDNNSVVSITKEQREALLSKLFAGKDITFKEIRKVLKLDDSCRFKNITYSYKKVDSADDKPKYEVDIDKSEKSSYFKFDKVKSISKILGRDISKDDADLLDAVSYILSMRKSDESRKKALRLNDSIVDNLTDNQKQALSALTDKNIEDLLAEDIKKFGNLSIKAMSKIIPFLEEGMVYDKACESAGYDFRAISHNEKKFKLHYNDLLDELQDITSPVVKRTISQTIKVINAIIEKYGSPCAIFIEFARELALNFRDRNDVRKKQESRRADNERIEKILREEIGIIPSGLDIVKYRLYEEQGCKCAYSQQSFEKVLGSVKAIFENNNTQVDHIIPYSQCYDDSYNNKVLVLSSENQKKGNRVPREYMTDDEFRKFEEYVNGQYVNNYKKQQNLLHKPLSQDQIKELNSRALNDTRYSARLIKQILENHLLFKESKFSKVPVRCVNGTITAYLRKIWGLTKHRFESDKHHAQDAAVIATATSGMINTITRYFQWKSDMERKGLWHKICEEGTTRYIDKDTGVTYDEEELNQEFGPQIVRPYDLFSKEIEARLLSRNPKANIYLDIYKSIGYLDEEIDDIKPVFISRMPTRKVLGKIHEETIRSAPYKKSNNKQYVTTKTSILKLKLNKDNEIADYPDKAKQDDKLLYNALRDRLVECGGDAKKAFENGFYKPKADGTPGNPVHTVKLEKVVTDGVAVNHGFADKTSMVRVDIFTRNGKNYAVPVYVNDVYSKTLPTKAIVANKPKDEWLDVTNTVDPFDFKFSLYPNDLVYISHKKPLTGTDNNGEKHDVNNEYLYYYGTDSSTGALSFINNDKSLDIRGAGIQSIGIFKKCTVDILGNISEVRHNTRQPFVFKKKDIKKSKV